MQFVTITSMLLGAALAAPAPLPDAKALAPRWSNIKVTPLKLKASNNRLDIAEISMDWDGTTVLCSHEGIKHGCDNKNFNFHMEDRDLFNHNFRAKFWVSRRLWNSDKEEVVSVDMGKITCDKNQQCTPEHNPAFITTPPTAPMPQPRALVARESTIAVTDVTLRAVASVLTWASIQLQWEDKTLWCFHRPAGGSKHECHDKNGKKDKDFNFDFHMEDKDLIAHNFYPKFWVSRKPWQGGEEKVVSVDMGKVKCRGGDLTSHCTPEYPQPHIGEY